MVLLVVLISSSCTKDWLDVTSGSEVRSDDQFKSESGFKDALIGAYIGMTDPALYSRDLTYNIVDLLSQQYGVMTTLSQYGEFQTYNYTSVRTVPRIEAVWNKTYSVIANVNNALTNIDKNKAVLNPISYAIIKGELLGLRAFLHFDLMRLYGYGNIANRTDLAGKFAIPYVVNFDKSVTPQLSYANTFELLNKDLNEAAVLLKEDPIFNNPRKPTAYYTAINRDGFYNKREQRMNYYAVKALQARVLQWQGGVTNLANAAIAAEEVIKDAPAKLINSPNVAVADPTLYPEHLFNLNVNAFADIVNPFLDGSSLTNYNALFIPTTRAQEIYETNNANIGAVDVRFNTLLSLQTKGYISQKYFQKTNSATRNVMPLIKVPEMYYIAAEHYVTANLPKAIEYLNLVRSSRGIIQNILPTADMATVTAEIMKEYQKEYVSEGQLFYFYKRLGKTTFPGLATTITANDKIYLFPYPASEIEFGNRVQ